MGAADTPSPAEQRIALAVAGELPLSALPATERAEAIRRIDAAISEGANSTSFADRLAAEGRPVLYVHQGQMVTGPPDAGP